MASTNKPNPIEANISRFRSLVGEMETVSTDNELADKVRQNKLLVLSLGQAMNLCEKLGVEVDDWANKVYESAQLATDGAFGDDELKRRVEASVLLADDFGLDIADEVGGLVERYNKAKDAFLAAVEPPKAKRGSGSKGTGRYSNNRTDHTSDSLRGMRKHLTGVLGQGWSDWKDDERVVIIDAVTDEEAKDE